MKNVVLCILFLFGVGGCKQSSPYSPQETSSIFQKKETRPTIYPLEKWDSIPGTDHEKRCAFSHPESKILVREIYKDTVSHFGIRQEKVTRIFITFDAKRQGFFFTTTETVRKKKSVLGNPYISYPPSHPYRMMP